MKISFCNTFLNFLKKQLPISLLLFNQGFAEEPGSTSLEQSFEGNPYLSDSDSSEPAQSSSESSPSEPAQSSLESPPSQGCHSPFHRMHISIRHNEAKGVGYRDGYTTLEGFGIYDRCMAFMPFLDLRGHVFNNEKFAGNVGIGGRSLLPSINHLLGYYVYYDVRQDRHHLTPQQVSPGIELLGKRMEYRLNGYFPVGDRKSHHYDFKFDSFKGHRIILKDKQRYAMSGGDAEVGVHLTQSTKGDFYAGAGPYYFSSPHANSWGGKARLLGRFKEYFSLEFSYSYDHLFGSIFQGNAAITLPFGKKLSGKKCTPRNNLVLSRAAFSPYRFEIPVVKKVRRKEKAINPATGAPWNVWFVNNTSSSDGTFESPFPTLLQAQNASGPNDMIYVFSGDGTAKGMNQGIILKNAQKLFGSGIAQFINTTQGGITIPAFTSTLPLIENPLANVINLSNENEISGVSLQNAGNFFISGSNIQGGMIHDNSISGFSNQGIFIIGDGNFLIANNRINYSGNEPIFINVNHSMNCTISNNFITVPISAFIGIRVVTLPGATFKGVISNNTIDNISFGIGLNANQLGSINCEVTNNSISNAHSVGIFIGAGIGPQGPIQANVFNNKIHIAGQGMQITEVLSSCIVIDSNQISNVSSNGILVSSSGTTQSNTLVTNNQISNVAAGFFGVNATANSPSTLCLQLLNNTVTNGAGYRLANNPGATFELDAANNIGSLTEVGTITPVPTDTCSCSP